MTIHRPFSTSLFALALALSLAASASAATLESFYSAPASDTPSRTVADPRGPMVPGKHAVLRHGIAYAPADAPDNIKRAIWAVNCLRDKPYKWGGGHGSFSDNGYDCSGTVSYALYHAGLLRSPLASAELASYGNSGSGRWFTIYARNGHTFATIAGLRLDTTDFYYGGDVGPRWHTDMRSTWGFSARHPNGV